MSSRPLAAFVGLWALAVGLRASESQTPPPPEAGKTTVAGVYATDQAKAGQAIFESTCLGGCHQMASHKGPAFKKLWDGRPLWDLFVTILEEMPKDDPGSLTPADTAQLVAYLLKLNGLPAGKDNLPVDEAALRKIKIEIPEGLK